MSNANGPKRKVHLRPHVEVHGQYSVEWSYHFPIEPGYLIESQFDLDFSGEKISGAAKSSLSEANLSHTRFSFADSAVEIRMLSLKLLKDTIHIFTEAQAFSNGRLRSDAPAGPPPLNSLAFVAKEYWDASYLAKLGIILQSDLKASRNAIRSVLRRYDGDVSQCINGFPELKRNLAQSFRSCFRLVQTSKFIKKIVSGNNVQSRLYSNKDDFKALLNLHQRLNDLAELGVALCAASIADLQDEYSRLCDKLEAAKNTLLESESAESAQSAAGRDAKGELRGLQERQLAGFRAFIVSEQSWLSNWTTVCVGMRSSLGLPSLAEIANNQASAANYFERFRALKKQHYQVWELEINLEPIDSKINFWIGAGAAGISAFVAACSLVFLNIGQVGLENQSLITLAVFLFANTAIYIVKDRLKEWLRLNLKHFLHLKSGKWTGQCVLRSVDKPEKNKNSGQTLGSLPREVAKVERETWWRKKTDHWSFHLWEEFHVERDSKALAARIIKQSWRLPLDEVLHTLDNTKHILKIPSVDGCPKHVPVLKQNEFPFSLTIRVKTDGKNYENPIEIDCATVRGTIHTAGDHIVRVQRF